MKLIVAVIRPEQLSDVEQLCDGIDAQHSDTSKRRIKHIVTTG